MLSLPMTGSPIAAHKIRGHNESGPEFVAHAEAIEGGAAASNGQMSQLVGFAIAASLMRGQ